MQQKGRRLTTGSVEVEWVRIACPVCGKDDSQALYQRVHETGSSLGRLPKTDVVCRVCGFGYTNPRPSPASMDRYYAEASAASGSVFHSTEPGSRLHGLVAERARFMRACIASASFDASNDAFVPSARRWLDVGCATGDLLMGIDLPGWEKTGLEPSRSAVALARGKGLDVAEGQLETSELESQSFGVVSCISALEHVQDPVAALRQLADLVVPNGLVFVEVPDSTKPIAQVSEFYCFEHLSHFTRGSLLRCLAMAGLEAVSFDDRVSISNLRVCARRVSDAALDIAKDWNERAGLTAAVERYSRQRARFEAVLTDRLSERLDRWRREGARVALYGAGVHTRFLMGLLDFESSVECVLDSDPSKLGTEFLRWQIHGPDEIAVLDLDAIVISTQAFEQEVYDQIEPVARAHGIEVVRCYA